MSGPNKRANYTSLIILLLLSFLFVLIGKTSVPTYAVKLDMSLGEIKMHFVDHNPIQIRVKDGKKGFIETKLTTDLYQSLTKIKSENNFELSETALASNLDLYAHINDGKVNSDTKNGKNHLKISVESKNGEASVFAGLDSSQKPDHKRVNTSIHSTQAKNGLLIVNTEPSKLETPTVAENISQSLGVALSKAHSLIDKYGKAQAKYALDELKHNLSNVNSNARSRKETAGGAGSLAGPGPINVTQLNPSSLFRLYLDGVKVMGRLIDTAVALKIYQPGTKKLIKGITPTITVAHPASSPGGQNVVLVDNIHFNKEKGYYYYNFHKANWLQEFQNLPKDYYNVYIDFGQSKKITLGCRLTESGKIIPAKG